VHIGSTRKHGAPTSLAGELRLRRVGKNKIPDLGAKAVGTDDQVVAARAPGGEGCLNAFGPLGQRRDRNAELDRNSGSTRRVGKDFMHDRAQNPPDSPARPPPLVGVPTETGRPATS
jgi:hypothetical protein